MRHIPTTRTAVEHLKLEAKRLRNPKTSLTAAREQVARKTGYDSWKHVTVCAAATSASGPSASLPAVLEDFLAREIRDSRLDADVADALVRGLVFAFDIKDASNTSFDEDVLECDDVLPHVARDLLLSYLAEDDELRELSSDDLLQYSMEHLSNFRFFRFAGRRSGPTLNNAFADVLGRYFFRPEFVWLDGKGVDMHDVREVIVDGQVLYSSERLADGTVVARPMPPQAGSEVAEEGRQPRVVELLAEIFEIEEFEGLLDGSLVDVHNSETGRVFARSSSNESLGFEDNGNLNGFVLSRLTELLRALGASDSIMEADVEVNGLVFCLTLVVPPVSNGVWSIVVRTSVNAAAHMPVAARVRV